MRKRRLVHSHRVEIDFALQHGNDAQAHAHGFDAQQRRLGFRLHAVQHQRRNLRRQRLPLERKVADLDAPAGGRSISVTIRSRTSSRNQPLRTTSNAATAQITSRIAAPPESGALNGARGSFERPLAIDDRSLAARHAPASDRAPAWSAGRSAAFRYRRGWPRRSAAAFPALS